MSRVLEHIGSNEVIILITGSQTKLSDYQSLASQVADSGVPVYVISYPTTLHTSYLSLATHGQLFSVAENSANVHPLIHLQVMNCESCNLLLHGYHFCQFSGDICKYSD